jgi:fumarate reductase subunit D
MTIGLEQRRQTAYRRRPLWLAALVHRISGVLLAVFLPLHFLALGLAIEGEARLDGFLKWSDQPIVKVAEAGLIVLLVVHLLGGLRLLVVENMPWRDGQKSIAMIALALAAAAGVLFLLRVI